MGGRGGDGGEEMREGGEVRQQKAPPFRGVAKIGKKNFSAVSRQLL